MEREPTVKCRIKKPCGSPRGGRMYYPGPNLIDVWATDVDALEAKGLLERVVEAPAPPAAPAKAATVRKPRTSALAALAEGDGHAG